MENPARGPWPVARGKSVINLNDFHTKYIVLNTLINYSLPHELFMRTHGYLPPSLLTLPLQVSPLHPLEGVTTHPSFISILLKIAISGILANFDAIFMYERMQIFKKPEDMLKSFPLPP